MDALPEGWTAYQDPEGRTYYANQAGETTWSRPGASAPSTPTKSRPSPTPLSPTSHLSAWSTAQCPPTPTSPKTLWQYEIPFSSTTLIASQFLAQIAELPEMVAAIGEPHARKLKEGAIAIETAIQECDAEEIAASVEQHVYDTVLLPLNSALVSEAVAATLSCLAGLREPGILPDSEAIAQDRVTEVLEFLAERLDAFQPFLFSVLVRVDAIMSSSNCNDFSTQRTNVALSGACAWLLAALLRTVGYRRFTSGVLWGWADRDVHWIMLLAKGMFTLDDQISLVPDTPLNGALCPVDLQKLQDSLATAVLGLASSSIAFDGIEQEVSQPDLHFAIHRTKLGIAFLESNIMESLLKASESSASRNRRVQLASFLRELLQTKLLLQDPTWMHQGPETVLIVEAARATSAKLRDVIGQQSERLWTELATVANTAKPPRSFLKDCCDIAFRTFVPAHISANFIEQCLADQNTAMLQADPWALAALCVLASNFGLASGADGGLSQVLSALPDEIRLAVVGCFTEWTGSLEESGHAHWSAFFEGLESAPPAPGHFEVTCALGSSHHAALGMNGLKQLLTGAPAELCCSLDHQLLVNPTRSVYGHVFETTVLALALAGNGNVCPITGQPLSLENCTPDGHLRRQAEGYINDWMHKVKWASKPLIS